VKISVLLRTCDFRGDHSADVLIAQEVAPNETVESLAERLLAARYLPYGKVDYSDVVEIRLVQPIAPKEPAP